MNPYFDKFFDVSLKHLEFSTTLVTLLLGAVAYVMTKKVLEAPKSDRPSILWIFLPFVFSVIALVLTLRSYKEIEDSLLQNAPEKFGMWWQPVRLYISVCLLLGTLFLAMLYAKLSKK